MDKKPEPHWISIRSTIDNDDYKNENIAKEILAIKKGKGIACTIKHETDPLFNIHFLRNSKGEVSFENEKKWYSAEKSEKILKEKILRGKNE